MQTESVLQTKNRSETAKNRFSVALIRSIPLKTFTACYPIINLVCLYEGLDGGSGIL